jgi:hypothetical protein
LPRTREAVSQSRSGGARFKLLVERGQVIQPRFLSPVFFKLITKRNV